MVFSQYKETCEVLLHYPTIGGEYIKYYVEKAIMNLIHANIDVHIRRLIAEFPGNGVNFISKLQSYCANVTFYEKLDIIGFSRKLHIKEGNKQCSTSRNTKMHRLHQFQWETVILSIN